MAMLTRTTRTSDNGQDGSAGMERAERLIPTDGSGPKAMISKETAVSDSKWVLRHTAKRTQNLSASTHIRYQP